MLLTEMARRGWDPFQDVRRLRSEVFGQEPRTAGAVAYPPINLWVGDNSIAVTAELPGIAADAVDLTIQEDTLTLRGEHKSEGTEKASWHRQERPYGRFARTVQLPFRVDADRVKARFDNGVLEIELERPSADRPRKIEIKGR